MLKKSLKRSPIDLEMVGTDHLKNGQICIQYAVILPWWLRVFEIFTCWKLPVMVKLYWTPGENSKPLGGFERQIKEKIWSDYPRSYEFAIAVSETQEGINETLTFWWGMTNG